MTTNTQENQQSSYQQMSHVTQLPQLSNQLPPREKIADQFQKSPQAQIVIKDTKLPKKLLAVNDCNELRRELLQLVKQEKEMEFKLKKEKLRLEQIGKQLVTETDRPNEQILAQKRAAKYGVEKQIEQLKAKIDAIKPVDVEKMQQDANLELQKDQQFYDFCNKAELVRKVVSYLLTDITVKAKVSTIASNKSAQQQERYQQISQMVNRDANKEYTDLLKIYNQKFDLRYQKMRQLNELLKSGFDMKQSAISETYQQKMNQIDINMQKTDRKYVEYLKSQGFEVQQEFEEEVVAQHVISSQKPKAAKQNEQEVKQEDQQQQYADIVINSVEIQQKTDEVDAKNEGQVEVEVEQKENSQ